MGLVTGLRSTVQRQFGGLPRTLWILLIGVVLTRIGTAVVPMLPFYVTRELKFDPQIAGLVVSVNGVGGMLGALLGGLSADRLGRRATLLPTLFLSVVALAATAVVRDEIALIACVFFLGLVSGAALPAMQAIVFDVLDPKDVMRAVGGVLWTLNLGGMLGTVVAGYLADHSFTLSFVVDGASTLAFALLVFFLIPETRPAEEPPPMPLGEGEPTPTGANDPWWVPFRDSRLMLYLLAQSMLWLVLAQQQVALPIGMQEEKMGATEFGWVVGLNGVILLVLQPFLNDPLRRRRRAGIFLFSSVGIGLGFLLYRYATSLTGWLVGTAVWTVGEIPMLLAHGTVMADLSNRGNRGRYQSVQAVVAGLAGVLAQLLGPMMVEEHGHDHLWTTCFFICLCAGLLHWMLARRRRVTLVLRERAAED